MINPPLGAGEEPSEVANRMVRAKIGDNVASFACRICYGTDIVLREHPVGNQDYLVCMDPHCEAGMRLPEYILYRRQPFLQIGTSIIGEEIATRIMDAINNVQHQRSTSAVGCVNPLGIHFLPMPIVNMENVWRHGTVSPGNTERLLFFPVRAPEVGQPRHTPTIHA